MLQWFLQWRVWKKKNRRKKKGACYFSVSKTGVPLVQSPHCATVCIGGWSNQAYLTWRSARHYSLPEYINEWNARQTLGMHKFIMKHNGIPQQGERKKNKNVKCIHGQGQACLWNLSVKHNTQRFTERQTEYRRHSVLLNLRRPVKKYHKGLSSCQRNYNL